MATVGSIFGLVGCILVACGGVAYWAWLLMRPDPRDGHLGINWRLPVSHIARANAFPHRRASEILLVFRVLAAGYSWYVAIRDCLWPRGPYKLFYYTEWTWWMMVAYLTLGVVAYFVDMPQRRAEARMPFTSTAAPDTPLPATASVPLTSSVAQDAEANEDADLAAEAKNVSAGTGRASLQHALTSVITVLAAILSVNALFVPMCIWVFMFPVAEFQHNVSWLITFSNLNMHILVLFFTYIDLLSTSLPSFWTLRGVVVMVPAVYGLFTVGRVALSPANRHCLLEHCDTSTHDAVAPVWPYPFMDTSSAFAPFFNLVLLLVHWVLWQAAIRWRICVSRRMAVAGGSSNVFLSNGISLKKQGDTILGGGDLPASAREAPAEGGLDLPPASAG